jgi:hypothetical protein
MSTILDALRKVEGDHRARTTDARARLLFSPTLSSLHRPRRQRSPWVIGAGLALFGFVAGIGVVFWQSSPQPREEQLAGAPTPLAQPGSQPSTSIEIPPAIPSAPLVEKTEQPALTAAIVPEPLMQPLMPEATYEIYAESLSPIVQRSPFVASIPAAREVATAPKPAPPPSPAKQQTQNFRAGGGAQAQSSTPVPDPAPANTSLSFLQWSPEPSKRLAFIKVNDGPLTLAQEGDSVGGYIVVEIRRDEVELRSGNSSFTLRPK